MKKQLTTLVIAGLFATVASAQQQGLSDTRGDLIKDRYENCILTLDGAKSCNITAPQNLSLSADTFFDFDKAVLKPAGKANLDELVADIKAMKDVNAVALSGHTDAIGSQNYNMRLSERRARAVENYLVQQGIPSEIITAVGYGKENPIATNDTAEGRAQNRRVDVMIRAAKQ